MLYAIGRVSEGGLGLGGGGVSASVYCIVQYRSILCKPWVALRRSCCYDGGRYSQLLLLPLVCVWHELRRSASGSAAAA